VLSSNESMAKFSIVGSSLAQRPNGTASSGCDDATVVVVVDVGVVVDVVDVELVVDVDVDVDVVVVAGQLRLGSPQPDNAGAP
jgi:hypothetical protein